MRVSRRDRRHLKAIRNSVDLLYQSGADLLMKEWASDTVSRRVLDVAPQDDGGWNNRDLGTPAPLVLTLDINPNSGADIVGDICEQSWTKGLEPFDAVFVAEVLEHVQNPFSAVQVLHSIMRPGGFLFASSPYDFRIHGPLPDNWRFTEHGWRALLKDFVDVEVIAVPSRRPLMPIAYRVNARRSLQSDSH